MQPTRCYVSQFIYFNKMLYMFQAVPLPIIRSSNCTYSFWYLSNLAVMLPAAIMVVMEMQFHPNHESSRQQQGLTIPEAVCPV
jgi:hypothetical protein